MMTKNKKLLGLTALTLGVVVCGASLTASLASADSVPTDTYAWEFTQMPNDFSIVKSDSASMVDVAEVNGESVLKVDNASGATEIRLPVQKSDFVMEFDCTRAEDADVLYSSISLKYRLAEDKASANEVRIHSKQKGIGGDNNGKFAGDNYYTQDWAYSNYTLWLEEATGQGVEHWHIKDMDTATLSNDEQQMHIFNYYYHELYIGEMHNYRVQVSGNLMELYIDGEMFLRDIIESNEDGTGLALRVDGDCTMLFDNVKIYSPKAYAEKRIAELPEIQAEQDAEVVDAYVEAVKAVKEYGVKFVGEEFSRVDGYETLTAKESKIEEYYQIKASKKPVLTVAWVLEKNYVTDDKIQAPSASAVDYNGKPLVVNVKIQFDGKTVRSVKGAFTAVEAGEYTVIYTAHDVDGNESVYTNKITVAQGEQNVTTNEPTTLDKENNWTLALVAGGCVVVAVLANVVVVMIRRKKQ